MDCWCVHDEDGYARVHVHGHGTEESVSADDAEYYEQHDYVHVHDDEGVDDVHCEVGDGEEDDAYWDGDSWAVVAHVRAHDQDESSQDLGRDYAHGHDDDGSYQEFHNEDDATVTVHVHVRTREDGRDDVLHALEKGHDGGDDFQR